MTSYYSNEASATLPSELILENEVVYSDRTYRATNTITAGPSFTIASGADVTFCAGNYVYMNPGFTANSGCSFYAYTDPSVGGEPLGKIVSTPTVKVYDIDINNEDSTQISSIGVPLEYSLSPNYPNPFNPATTFKYSLREETKVSIKIYNLLGKEIATLVSETRPAGYQSVTWNRGRSFWQSGAERNLYLPDNSRGLYEVTEDGSDEVK